MLRTVRWLSFILILSLFSALAAPAQAQTARAIALN